jgi:beta-barrel assembly-enhancing protease
MSESGISHEMRAFGFHPALKRKASSLFLILLLAGCAARQTGPLRAGRDAFPAPSGFNQFSPEQEVQIGRQAAAEADASMPLLPARGTISDYVSTLGFKLAKQLPPNDYDWSFKVVNEKDINAFALPGGPVRVNLGTIQAADNEAQLAGVIAHEISHVYMRHATRNASKESIAQLPIAILGSIAGNGVGGELARIGLQFGMGSVFMKYSRDAESEADRVGAKIMYEAGYDPMAMADFFSKLEKEGGAGGPQFLSDHPNPGNRAAAVKMAIAELPQRPFNASSKNFQEVKQIASTMKPYTAEQVAQMQRDRQAKLQQAAIAQIAPSGQFQMLRGGSFEMAYPSNWRVMKGPASLVIAPEAGVGENAIAYGVVMSGYTPQQPQALEQTTQQVFRALEQSNPGMRALGGKSNINVNGMPANVVNLVAQSPLSSQDGQAVAERDVLLTLQRRDGSVLWMLFIAPEPHFNSLEPTFQKMIQSLQVAH